MNQTIAVQETGLNPDTAGRENKDTWLGWSRHFGDTWEEYLTGMGKQGVISGGVGISAIFWSWWGSEYFTFLQVKLGITILFHEVSLVWAFP